ncbi:hydroxyethylthiazole kinase [Leuconostoc palmae]|uniref:hydroxyethylthiazole kinase n=1 Tax=Leuconostoc palmae TaxID=501487 RepID=UPI001C7D499F|nr:hydroxyethylthiazole kinase [Leuconostoc palmae]
MNLSELKKQTPLVFNYANYVTAQFVANTINVVGGSPIMSRELAEFSDLVQVSDAIVVNTGTWQRAELPATIKLVQLANLAKKVVVLDPVAVSIPSRSLPVHDIMANSNIDIIRGNAAEIAWFAGIELASHGIDSTGDGDILTIAKTAAKKTGAIIAMSGKVDVVSDGQQAHIIDVDVPLLATNVGTGDALSALIGAFNGDTISTENTLRAMAMMKLAGTKATLKVKTPGYFVNQLLDECCAITDSELETFIENEVKYG